jgi:hypothetical protein
MLQSQRYHEGVAIFTNVLTLAKDCVFGATTNACSRGRWMRFFNPQSCRRLTDDTTGCFVFQSAITVDATTILDASSFVSLTSVAAYNLALTYHLGAVTTKPCESNFLNALSFYQLAHKLQQQSNDMDEEFGVLLSMAIANNIGHMHVMAGDAVKAAQCFQHLLNTIMYVLDRGCWSGSVLSPLIMDGFLQNAQRWVMIPQPSPAA